jgi:CBS-domain-containing membrane protein
MIKVFELMTKKVVTVTPETPLAEAAVTLNERDFIALPVVDDKGKLVGLFNEQSMITDSSYAHMKVLLQLFSKLEFYKKDTSPIKEELKKIMSLKVGDVMMTAPATIHAGEEIDKASSLLSDPRNNPLPVVNDSKELIGILSLSDLTKLYGVTLSKKTNLRHVDENIDEFMEKFEKQFVVVSRFRIRAWLISSILLVLIGFAIAMFLILRVSV